MNSYYTILVISILYALLGQGCSRKNPSNPNMTAQVSVPSAANIITSGSINNNEGITEAKIKNTIQTLNSIKFNKSMFDFSNPENVKALQERDKMISMLMKDPSILQREDVKTTLIDLFNNQTKYAMEYVHAHPGKGLGENYAEGGPNLGGLMIKYMDKRSLYTEIVLLNDTHDFLATYWKDSSQLVMQRMKDSPNNGNILDQITALGRVQKEKHITLDPETVKSFNNFAFNKLKSNEPYIRESAVEALKYLTAKNDKEIIEALKIVAKTDPYRYYARPVYPVREAAQRALEYIDKQ